MKETDNREFQSLYESFCEKCDSVAELCQERLDLKVKDIKNHNAQITTLLEDKANAYNQLYLAVNKSGKNLHSVHENNLVVTEHIKRLNDETISLRDVVKSAQGQLEQSKKLVEDLKAEKSAVEGDLVKKQNKYGETQKSMSQNIALTKKYLGLEVRPLRDNRVQFLFHNVFPEESNVIMFVIMRLSNKVYELLDSEPPLENLKDMEQRLNETNNLAGFVQHVRKRLITETEKLSKENIRN